MQVNIPHVRVSGEAEADTGLGLRGRNVLKRNRNARFVFETDSSVR